MKTLKINLPNPYSIFFENGLLQSKFIAEFCRDYGNTFVIITDSNLKDSFGKLLQTHLSEQQLRTFLLAMPAGENYKSREIKQQLEDEMFELHCGRDTCIIALGGGVVTDMAGFIAATFCRGVPIIYIPTTLLAMVDASIGGKTAVNTPFGKNLIGAFSQPKAVFIDPETLQSLSSNEWKSGMVETIKHALIADEPFFHLLQNNTQKFIQQDTDFMAEVIMSSIEIKKNIVEQDEKETGMRALLNFGHTIGHAIETLENYHISHGEAVAIGIIVESYISMRNGYLAEDEFNEIRNIFTAYHLPLTTSAFSDREKFKELLTHDKKALANTARFVLLDKIGQPHRDGEKYVVPISEDVLDMALLWAAQQFKDDSTH